jgi:hypothetical protein
MCGSLVNVSELTSKLGNGHDDVDDMQEMMCKEIQRCKDEFAMDSREVEVSEVRVRGTRKDRKW